MSMSIHRNAAIAATPRAKPANFGQLNSAIVRGDLAAAEASLGAIEQSTSKPSMAVKARGDLASIKTAIAAGDPETARSALGEFRKQRVQSTDPSLPEVTPPATTAPSAAEVISLMTGSEPVDLR
ncbi:MAG: hypothetical protein JHD35_07820 [Sphingopyxis sp.]|nr:hypothetical protein [Sphingopyxis sp.]